MNKLLLTALVLSLTGCSLFASKVEANADITGSVESRCIVNTDTPGVYGNPNAYTLTTTPASGGQKPIVRFDVSLANAYYAQVSYPTSFSSDTICTTIVSCTRQGKSHRVTVCYNLCTKKKGVATHIP